MVIVDNLLHNCWAVRKLRIYALFSLVMSERPFSKNFDVIGSHGDSGQFVAQLLGGEEVEDICTVQLGYVREAFLEEGQHHFVLFISCALLIGFHGFYYIQ